MTSTQHTPTPGPWEIFEHMGHVYIRSSTETYKFDNMEPYQYVCMMQKNYGENTSTVREGRELANAASIVLAHNTYERLVKFCGEVCEAVERGDYAYIAELAEAEAK